MSETELKREILETRNQVIKTDNHVANLSIDIRGFERRFDAMEKRARVATIGVHALVAAVIGLAAFAVVRAQSGALRGTIEELETRAAAAEADASKRVEAMRTRVNQIEQDQQRRSKASALAAQILGDLEAGRDTKALDAIVELDLDALSDLERNAVEGPAERASREAAEAAYRSGKRHWDGGRDAAAIKDLTRAVSLTPEGRFSDQSRYLLVTALWRQGRYDELAPHVTVLMSTQKDRNLLDELTFIQGSSLAHSGKTAEAKVLFQKLTRSRYATSAKAYVTAIDASAELPKVPGSR